MTRTGMRWAMLVPWLAVACVARAADPEIETSREIELRVRADDATRLHLLASFTRQELRGFREGALGLAVHHAWSPRWAWRLGARALASTEEGDGTQSDERRAIADIYWTRTFGDARWTLSNRNRLDLRWFSDAPFAWRLRERAMLERALPLLGHPFVAFASAELFHDSRQQAIARGRVVAGLTIPLCAQASADLYWQSTRTWRPTLSDTGTIGVALVVGLDAR